MSFETITQGGVLSATLHRVTRVTDGLEPLAATRDPRSRNEIMHLVESPAASGLIDPEALSLPGALWIITLSELGGDFGTRWQRRDEGIRFIQGGGDSTPVYDEGMAVRVREALDKIRVAMIGRHDPLEEFIEVASGVDPSNTKVIPRGLILIDNRWAVFTSRYVLRVESEVGEMMTTVEVLRAAYSFSTESHYLDLPDRRHAVSSSDMRALATMPRVSGVMAAELSQSEDVLWMTRTTVTQLRGGEVADETVKVRAGDSSMEALSDDVDLDAGIFDTLSSMS